MREALKQFLFKKQGSAGTPETGLVASDLLEAEMGGGIEPDVVVTKIELVGDGFGQDAAVVGRHKCNATLTVPMRNFGAKDSLVEPDWGAVLECSDFALTSNNGYYIYTPSNTSTTEGTLWVYSGSLATSGALLRKAGNLKFSPKFSLDFASDSITKIEFSGSGRYGGAPTDATQPTVTKNKSAVPPLRGVTMQINGDSSYRCLNMEIDMNQDIEPTTLPSHISGVGVTLNTTRKATVSAKCYRVLTGVSDPEAALFALTEGIVSVAWSVTNECIIQANYMQITKVTPSEENGVQTWDIEGQLNMNDFTVRVLGANSSSSSSSSSS